METFNTPNAPLCPVITAWEGEVVDNANHSFLTQKWGATREVDMKHWRKFVRGFSPLAADVSRNEGRTQQLAQCPFIFMRWKETFFVNNESSGLTIAGFYYGRGGETRQVKYRRLPWGFGGIGLF